MSKEEINNVTGTITKKTENETSNHLIDIAIERTDRVYVGARLIFKKETPLKKIIGDTKKFIDELKNGKNNGDGFT